MFAFAQDRPAWRVVVMGLVAAVTVFWANTAFAQFPGGFRNDGDWYYCFSAEFQEGPLVGDWDDIECLNLLFAPLPGGGGYESVNFEAEANAASTNSPNTTDSHIVRGWIIPARGIKSYDFSCTMTAQTCFWQTGGSRFAQARTNSQGGFNSTADVSVTAPGAPLGGCTASTLNVVSDHFATGYDNFFDDVFDGNFFNDYAQFNAQAGASNGQSSMLAQYQCRVIAWESWPAWLDDNPEWEPDIGDLVPVTPTPGFSPGITLSVTPLAPVSNTVDVIIGEPGTPECTVIIPSGGISETVFGNEIDAGWADYEVCTQATELHVEFFGIDFGTYLVLALGAASIGVVLRIFRTG